MNALTTKRSLDRPSSHSKKRPKHSKSPPDNTNDFPQLDPKEFASRIASRQRDIDKGKNTAGYHAYRQQVALTARKPRSMETPLTPKPTWDVSVKRWQGTVRAWRKALHQYDPPELKAASPKTAALQLLNDSTPISMDGSDEQPTVHAPVRNLDFAAAAAADGESSDDDDELL